ncbi:hypothetical protein, partial [Neoroseomonas rubea]|uniref:hypothetical protein n=1 Tax=Neoroseomonas rubea TaxID=2748666 RepID=UPI001E3F4F2F
MEAEVGMAAAGGTGAIYCFMFGRIFNANLIRSAAGIVRLRPDFVTLEAAPAPPPRQPAVRQAAPHERRAPGAARAAARAAA